MAKETEAQKNDRDSRPAGHPEAQFLTTTPYQGKISGKLQDCLCGHQDANILEGLRPPSEANTTNFREQPRVFLLLCFTCTA